MAQICAVTGYNVVLNDMSADALAHAQSEIEGSLKKVYGKKVAKEGLDQAAADAEVANILGRIKMTTSMEEVAAEADLNIEAIVENLDIKLDFFEKLGAMSKPDSVLATNTSSYPVTKMADASGVPERVCGIHYFNPVQIMKLVEVVSTEKSDPALIAKVTEFVNKTGKVPVQAKDTPGFIVNRLLVPYITEAVALVARGDASPSDVDTAMKLGAGHPMGPITLSDYVGNDINLACMKVRLLRLLILSILPSIHPSIHPSIGVANVRAV